MFHFIFFKVLDKVSKNKIVMSENVKANFVNNGPMTTIRQVLQKVTESKRALI